MCVVCDVRVYFVRVVCVVCVVCLFCVCCLYVVCVCVCVCVCAPQRYLYKQLQKKIVYVLQTEFKICACLIMTGFDKIYRVSGNQFLASVSVEPLM